MTGCGAVIGHLEHRALAQRHRLHRRGVQLQTRRLAGLNLHIITVLFMCYNNYYSPPLGRSWRGPSPRSW